MAIQFLRGTSSSRSSSSAKSVVGQPLYETDTGKLYVGDGSSNWSALQPVKARPLYAHNISWSSSSWDAQFVLYSDNPKSYYANTSSSLSTSIGYIPSISANMIWGDPAVNQGYVACAGRLRPEALGGGTGTEYYNISRIGLSWSSQDDASFTAEYTTASGECQLFTVKKLTIGIGCSFQDKVVPLEYDKSKFGGQ